MCLFIYQLKYFNTTNKLNVQINSYIYSYKTLCTTSQIKIFLKLLLKKPSKNILFKTSHGYKCILVLTASRTVTAVTPWASGMLNDHSLPTKIFTIQLINCIICVSQIIKLNKAIPRERGGGKENRSEVTGRCLYCKQLSPGQLSAEPHGVRLSCHPAAPPGDLSRAILQVTPAAACGSQPPALHPLQTMLCCYRQYISSTAVRLKLRITGIEFIRSTD